MTKEEIAEKLKAARVVSNLTQKDAASRIGRKQQTLASWETGQSQPDANTLFMLCELYNTSVDELFGFSKKFNIAFSERTHIEKYRTLDNDGRQFVDLVLEREYARCTAPPEPAPLELREERAEYNVIPGRFSVYKVSAGHGAYLGPETFEIKMIEKNELTRRTLFYVTVSGNSMEPIYHDGDMLMVEKAEDIEPGEVGVFTLDGEGYVKKLGDGELISLNHEYDPIPMNDSITVNGRVIGVLDPEWIVD